MATRLDLLSRSQPSPPNSLSTLGGGRY
jgi:hypothetical protein